MKNLKEILNQKPIFLNDWNVSESYDKCKLNLIRNFEYTFFSEEKINLSKYENINILFASYSCDNYEGDAYVLFEREGQLFEVFGSHCSCYGLEGQFEEEESSLDAIEHRLLNGTFAESYWTGNVFKKELCKFLGVNYVENSKDYDF